MSAKSPAFPPSHHLEKGLTKREYFAIAVLQGMMSNSHLSKQLDNTSTKDKEDAAAHLVKQAVLGAEAPLKELEKTS